MKEAKLMEAVAEGNIQDFKLGLTSNKILRNPSFFFHQLSIEKQGEEILQFYLTHIKDWFNAINNPALKDYYLHANSSLLINIIKKKFPPRFIRDAMALYKDNYPIIFIKVLDFFNTHYTPSEEQLLPYIQAFIETGIQDIFFSNGLVQYIVKHQAPALYTEPYVNTDFLKLLEKYLPTMFKDLSTENFLGWMEDFYQQAVKNCINDIRSIKTTEHTKKVLNFALTSKKKALHWISAFPLLIEYYKPDPNNLYKVLLLRSMYRELVNCFLPGDELSSNQGKEYLLYLYYIQEDEEIVKQLDRAGSMNYQPAELKYFSERYAENELFLQQSKKIVKKEKKLLFFKELQADSDEWTTPQLHFDNFLIQILQFLLIAKQQKPESGDAIDNWSQKHFLKCDEILIPNVYFTLLEISVDNLQNMVVFYTHIINNIIPDINQITKNIAGPVRFFCSNRAKDMVAIAPLIILLNLSVMVTDFMEKLDEDPQLVIILTDLLGIVFEESAKVIFKLSLEKDAAETLIQSFQCLCQKINVKPLLIRKSNSMDADSSKVNAL